MIHDVCMHAAGLQAPARRMHRPHFLYARLDVIDCPDWIR